MKLFLVLPSLDVMQHFPDVNDLSEKSANRRRAAGSCPDFPKTARGRAGAFSAIGARRLSCSKITSAFASSRRFC